MYYPDATTVMIKRKKIHYRCRSEITGEDGLVLCGTAEDEQNIGAVNLKGSMRFTPNNRPNQNKYRFQ